MRTHRTTRLRMVMALGAVLLLALALAGNTGGTCTPNDPVPACFADSDCGGEPPVDCVGSWECVEGACDYVCGDPTLPPERCWSDQDCGAGETCAFDDTTGCCPPGAFCLMYVPACQGVCLPDDPDPPFECQANADCARDEICVFDWNECPAPPGCDDGEMCPAVCGAPVIVGSHCEANRPEECLSDADCGPNEICAFPADCGWECPPGEYCPMWDMACLGSCVAVEPPPEGCRTDADCAAGELCVMPPRPCYPGEECLGVCAHGEPPVECWIDADCGPGMRCDAPQWLDGECCPPDTYCAMYLPACEPGVCVPDEPPPVECWSDADCRPGMRCEFVDNCAVPDCGPEEDCMNGLWNCGGVCVPAENPFPYPFCMDDSDCHDGERCAPEFWLVGGADSGNPAGMVCYDEDGDGHCDNMPYGQCVPVEPPPECWSDADCGPGYTCDVACYGGACPPGEQCERPDEYCYGVCVPVEPPPQECWSDADCGPHEMCLVACAGGGACPDGSECEPYADPYCWGECVPREEPECWTDADCPTGFHCEPLYWPMGADGERVPCFDDNGDGICDWDEPYGGGVCVREEQDFCWSDADCGPGERCQFDEWCWYDCAEGEDCGGAMPSWCEGVCVPVEQPECWSDADCPDGQHCEMMDGPYPGGSGFAPCFDEDGDGVCDWDEPLPGVCVADPPPSGDCAADWDCAADERCQLDWSLCEMDCGPDMDCMPCVGRCVPIKECLDDSDCPGGTVCDFGGGDCRAADCPDADMNCIPMPCMGICREPDFWTQA